MKKYISPITLLALVSCQPTLIAEFNDKAVVESYLHAGNPPVVKISKLIPFRDDVEFSDEDIDMLAVTVTDDTTGESRVLAALGEGRYSADGFTITEGHTYSLAMPYNGETVTAATTIPPQPVGMAVSTTVIEAMGHPGLSRAPGYGGAEITWENPDKAYYMIAVENTETNPTPIFDEEEEDWPRPSFRTEPTQGTSSVLSPMSFSYYGWHDVILIRMQPEYVLLYSSQGETSQTLTEIHANIEGGYGIFTGINSDTLRVKVVASSSVGTERPQPSF